MDITMPQLGETVTEGTIIRWFKQVGEEVALDEILFEISTDKVDSEVPSPAAGVLTEILANEGDDVEVGARLSKHGSNVVLVTDQDDFESRFRRHDGTGHDLAGTAIGAHDVEGYPHQMTP